MQPVSPRIVELLNEALTLELTVTNAYFLHARMLDAQGLPRLGKVFYDLSIGEMRDADAIIQRILFFDGHPNLQRLGPVPIGETAEEMLRLGLEGENKAVAAVQRGRARVPRARRPRHRLEVRRDGRRRGGPRRLVRGAARRDRDHRRLGVPRPADRRRRRPRLTPPSPSMRAQRRQETSLIPATRDDDDLEVVLVTHRRALSGEQVLRPVGAGLRAGRYGEDARADVHEVLVERVAAPRGGCCTGTNAVRGSRW